MTQEVQKGKRESLTKAVAPTDKVPNIPKESPERKRAVGPQNRKKRHIRNKRETVSAHKREPGAQEGHVSALCKEWAGRSQAARWTYPGGPGRGSVSTGSVSTRQRGETKCYLV